MKMGNVSKIINPYEVFAYLLIPAFSILKNIETGGEDVCNKCSKFIEKLHSVGLSLANTIEM
jgi:hypothetical protein